MKSIFQFQYHRENKDFTWIRFQTLILNQKKYLWQVAGCSEIFHIKMSICLLESWVLRFWHHESADLLHLSECTSEFSSWIWHFPRIAKVLEMCIRGINNMFLTFQSFINHLERCRSLRYAECENCKNLKRKPKGIKKREFTFSHSSLLPLLPLHSIICFMFINYVIERSDSLYYTLRDRWKHGKEENFVFHECFALFLAASEFSSHRERKWFFIWFSSLSGINDDADDSRWLSVGENLSCSIVWNIQSIQLGAIINTLECKFQI